MKLIQWTLFVDMLGFSAMNGAVKNEEDAKEFIEFMDNNRKIFEQGDNAPLKKYYESDKYFNLYKYYEIRYAFVSDSLFITYYPKEADDLKNEDLALMHSANALFIIMIRLQAFLFHCFAEKGIFLRGGISNKYCYIQENFAVGEGLIEAYQAESKFAKNPRIVLHPEIVKNSKLMDKINLLSNLMYGGKSLLEKDNDDLYFLDHIRYVLSTTDLSIPMIARSASRNPFGYISQCQTANSYLTKHADAIKKKIQEIEEEIKAATSNSQTSEIEQLRKVADKYYWLRDYHNSRIKQNPKFGRHIIG